MVWLLEGLVHTTTWLNNVRSLLIGVGLIITPTTIYMMLMLFHLTIHTQGHLLVFPEHHPQEVRVLVDQTQGVVQPEVEELTRQSLTQV